MWVFVTTTVVGTATVLVPLTRRRVVCTVAVDVAMSKLVTVATNVVETLE